MIEIIRSFFSGGNKYTVNDTTQTVIEQPGGSNLTYNQVIVLPRDPSVQSPQEPGAPIILSSPVTIPNDALPVNLEELGVFLTPNTKYTFQFRVTKYSSDVQLALGFVVPGDATPATISWNETSLDGIFLGDDDELILAQFGNDEYLSPEITGTITTNDEGGFFKPQIRQQTADNQTSEITEAYLEVIINGN